MRQQVETAPLPGGVFIILANTLAALLTALAVGLAMRRMR
jgi:hypothetical protein